jgi:hypothetical protein
MSALKTTKAKELEGEERQPLSLWDISSQNSHQVGLSQLKWLAQGEYFSHDQIDHQEDVAKDG